MSVLLSEELLRSMTDHGCRYWIVDRREGAHADRGSRGAGTTGMIKFVRAAQMPNALEQWQQARKSVYNCSEHGPESLAMGRKRPTGLRRCLDRAVRGRQGEGCQPQQGRDPAPRSA